MAKTKARPAGRMINTEINIPTMVRNMLGDGRILGVDGSVWLVLKSPMSPIVDAKTPDDRINAFIPLMNAYEELATLTPISGNRRALSRRNYRATQLLMVNRTRKYVPPVGDKLSPFLKESFPDQPTDQRLLLLAVRLRDTIGNGGLKEAVDSVVETLVDGGAPLSDYDKDARAVGEALARHGFTVPKPEELAVADSWWNQGYYPDTVSLAHSEHMHIFSNSNSARMAADAGADDCEQWPAIPHHRSLTFATLYDFDFNFLSPADMRASWATPLIDDGAVAISVRARIEPAKVTRDELRRQRKRYLDDIMERFQAGKMERSEQVEMEQTLKDVEAVYAGGTGSATLVDASVLVAFDGEIEDITTVGFGNSSAQLRIMNHRQNQSLSEMMLCSPVSANPVLNDLPSQSIACAGLQSLNRVGDRSGALLGFTERDRQPVLFDPLASTKEDTGPFAVHIGGTGSGKLTSLATRIPTPFGWTTMGELEVGSAVIGRDGKPCKVTYLSPIEEKPDLFRITLSDGQTIDADANHQWVVSDFAARVAPRTKKRQAAITSWGRARKLVDDLQRMAAEYEPEHESTLGDLHALVSSEISDCPWSSSHGIKAALRMMDAPFRTEVREVMVARQKATVVKTDPVKLYPVEETLLAAAEIWSRKTGPNAVRWSVQNAKRLAAAQSLLAAGVTADHMTIPGIFRELSSHGDMAGMTSETLRRTVNSFNIEPMDGFSEVRVPVPAQHGSSRNVSLFPTRNSLGLLAARVAQQYGDEPLLEAGEKIMSTAEIIDQGLRAHGGQSNFTIRVTEGLQLPAVDLPIDPYILGAWLGDGSSTAGQFTSGVSGACTDSAGVTDQDHLMDELAPFYEPWVGSDKRGITVHARGLTHDLRKSNLLGYKHIPSVYLRASFEQRLALLQGLMDTDGHVGKDGSCEFTQAKIELVEQVVELVRSLGIKTGPIQSGESHYVLIGKDGVKTRHEGTGKHRITFTTDLPVFRLPRKLERIPTTLRETQKYLYIESIEPISPEPGRCITVDSEDSTYLIEGFVPTHNTQYLLWKVAQYQKLEVPQIFIDPKQGSDFSEVIEHIGGTTVSLDELASSDGILDPMRFSENIDVGVSLAVSMIATINPFGEDMAKYEAALQSGLTYGAREGGNSIGRAIELAMEKGRIPGVIGRTVLDLAASHPMFGAMVGRLPRGESLRVSRGLTYIKTGSASLALTPGVVNPTMDQRISQQVVRMLVFGSKAALSGRDGVIHLDEAWVFLGGGRSELEEFGRTGRSQRVIGEMYTQRVSDALNAGLEGYISRGTILPIEDKREAAAALQLFGMDPDARLGRVTAKKTIGEEQMPNRASFHALRDPETRKVLRGSIGIVVDLAGRAVPTEIKLPASFLQMTSTNMLDHKQREEQREARLKLAS